ncbi:MAG: YihY/virulence factor BrkB family protein [Pseudonocardiales bacterium]|nr:YihY/virulence factor BrkB family protein [Jatrophihabitantaceae bacterium]MCW2604751.1 YihY/virulence factor BrkB family protein [Pseudonocardiales bacterium]
MRPVARARELALRTVKSAWDNRILGLSAEAAFWQLLSLPSLFLALLATLGYISNWFGADTVDRAQAELLEFFSKAFSDEVVDQLIAPTVSDVLREGRAEVISIGFVVALWAGSSATATFVNTITIAYGQRELRGAVRSRLLALWLYLGSVLLGVVLLPLIVLGPKAMTDLIPEGEARDIAGSIIRDAYWPTAAVLLLLALTSFYRLAPPRRLPWLRGLPGAVLAMAVFLAGSAGLREYVTFIVAHGYTYGRLAAPIAALLFFYILAMGVLLGAEFNAAIEHTWPTVSRRAARDAAASDKRWQRLPQGNDDPAPALGGEGSGLNRTSHAGPPAPMPTVSPVPQLAQPVGPGARQAPESPPPGRDS